MRHEIPIVSPAIVGREAEIAFLQQQWELARGGSGRTVVLAGEAGIGKSRLVARVVDVARKDSALVLLGRCFESDHSLPFAPLRDLLDRFVAETLPDEVTAALSRFPPEIGMIAPELVVRLQSHRSPAFLNPPPDRRQISHAFAQCVTQLTADQPLLLIVEDVHWSDDASLDCLQFLARRVSSHRLLVVLTYRPDDAQQIVLHTLADLARARMSIERQLVRLSPDQASRMVQAMFGLDRRPRSAFVHALFDLTDGNPFFIEEVIASLVAAGDIYRVEDDWERKRLDQLKIPHTVRDAVHRRVEKLSQAARELLVLAAVMGQRIEFSMLTAITGLPEAELVTLLKELIDARLIVEESTDRFVFRHALTRQAVESDLLGRERVALHRQVASVLLDIAGNDPEPILEDLSRHLFAAGAWDDVIAYGSRAGIRSLALGAPRSAIQHFDRVIASASELGVAAPIATLRRRGQSHDVSGDFEAARRDFEEALRLARVVEDRAEQWDCLLRLGFLWSSRDYDVAFAYFEEALDLARQSGDQAMLAHSLNRMGNWLANQDQWDLALAHHREALGIFVRLHDRPGQAATLDMAAMAAHLSGDMVSAAGFNARALPLFRELGDRAGEAGSFGLAAPNTLYDLDLLVGLGTLPEVIEHFESSVSFAQNLGWNAGEAMALAILGEAWGASGDFGKSLDALERALAIAEDIEHQQWIVQALWGLGGLHVDFLDFQAAQAYLERALTISRSVHSTLWTNAVAGQLASVFAARGNVEAAADVLDTELDPAMSMRGQSQRYLWCGRIDQLLATNEPDRALVLFDRMYGEALNLLDEGDIPRLALAKARALVMVGDAGLAELLLASALTTAQSQGAGPMSLRLLVARAALSQASASSEFAVAARNLIARMANSISNGDRRDAYVRMATDLLPDAGRPVPRVGGLTPRETEVASLVADGSTNRDIAEQLFLSERTVEAHVAAVMRKLGFKARTQIAAWVTIHNVPGSST